MSAVFFSEALREQLWALLAQFFCPSIRLLFQEESRVSVTDIVYSFTESSRSSGKQF